MRAMVLRGVRLSIEAVANPTPGPGEVLAKVLACGVCGSDLHAASSGRREPGVGLIMGHEFVAEVVEAGPGAESWKPGTRVTSMPLLLSPGAPAGTLTIGYSAETPGAFGEYVVMSEPLLLRVADNLADEIAATTEPCAVGLHALHRAKMQPGESALVMGAGPIGLMTVLWLKNERVRPVVVTDPSEERRALAKRLGADLVLDPAAQEFPQALEQSFGDSFRPSSDPPGSTFSRAPVRSAPDVVFECVGMPGTLQQAMGLVQARGRVIVVGVCATEDRLVPAVGVTKELAIQFVLGYTADEYAQALAALCEGSIDPSPMVTRTVGLDELPSVFAELASSKECKVIVIPSRQ